MYMRTSDYPTHGRARAHLYFASRSVELFSLPLSFPSLSSLYNIKYTREDCRYVKFKDDKDRNAETQQDRNKKNHDDAINATGLRTHLF